MCLNEQDVELVQPYLDAVYCKEMQQAVNYALMGRNICVSMEHVIGAGAVPHNVLLVSSWLLFLEVNETGAEEPAYLH